MEKTLIYRLMQPTDILAVSKLLARVFNEFIAPEYSSQGIQAFHRYIQPTELLARQQKHHFALICVARDRIVGVIEVRNCNHISLLFVAPEFQRRGIAKELFRRALQICLSRKPFLLQISVNSSAYAVPIYEKLGFRQTGEKQIINGIGFIPMMLKLSDWQDVG
jgi:GNAT superfamily N-acetyltransferase